MNWLKFASPQNKAPVISVNFRIGLKKVSNAIDFKEWMVTQRQLTTYIVHWTLRAKQK